MCYKTVRGIVPPCVQALITACVGNSEDAHCRPLQILLYGSGNHYVGQLVGEPHAESCEEG